RRSIHLQAVALWLLAGLLGVTAALILSQLFFRQALLEARDHATLRALGMERDQLWAIGMARAALMGIVAAVVATVTALALSPLLSSTAACRTSSTRLACMGWPGTRASRRRAAQALRT